MPAGLVAVTAPAGVGTPEEGSDHDRITEGHDQKRETTTGYGRPQGVSAA
jgi:hypothetical protein